ncbi:MAG: hypothetical protein J6X55_07450 [Victivallales bacterium]|nr:hypothetical protein [Victivallales bacterium]
MLLYVDASINALVNKIQGTEYKQYLPRPPFNAYPIYFMVHVKDDADCETEDANVLNVGDDPGDQVDFIFGYVGQGGNAVYDSTGKTSSLSVRMTNNQGVESFESNIETVFSNNSSDYGTFNTYGLSLNPSTDEPWDYSHWKVAESYADINAAKKEARDNKRPLLIAFSKTSGCVACMEHWRSVVCDGMHAHDKYCKLGNTENDHPICQFAENNKIVLLYIEVTKFTPLTNKIQGTEYKQYLPRPPFNVSPIYFMVHVKDDADCETEDFNVLNVGNDPGDQVDFIFGYVGQGGQDVYDSTGKKSSLSVRMTNNQGFNSFKSNIETILSDNRGLYGDFNTYGLTLEPPVDENDGSSISKAMDESKTPEIGRWTKNYSAAKSAAKSAGKTLIVAFVDDFDYTSSQAKSLDEYSKSFVDEDNYLAVIDGSRSGANPMCPSLELMYLRSNGTIVGRLSNDPDAPTDGTVAIVANFNGDNANIFSQFEGLASDANEESNNTKSGAVSLGTSASEIQIGGVDAVDWFTFGVSEEDVGKTWMITLTATNSANVTVELDDSTEMSVVTGDLKNGVTISYKPTEANDKVYLKVSSNVITKPQAYRISVEKSATNYIVNFSSEKIHATFSNNGLLEIPVTLTERNRQAGDVSVRVKLTEYDEELYGVGLKETPEGRPRGTQTVTWTEAEKTSSPTKVVYLFLPELDEADATWEGHKDISLELQDASDNAVIGTTNRMTVEVSAAVDSAVFKDGDSANVTLDNGGKAVSYRIVAPETSAVYWENISGEIPQGLTVTVEKTNGVYELKLKPGNITEGSYTFTIKLYSVVTGTQIKSGGTMKITCTVTSKQADQSATRFKEPNTKISGAILEESKESEGKRNPESGDSSSKKDVKGSIDVTVGEENRVSATVITRYGEATLKGKWTDDDDPSKLMATLDGYTEDNYHYQLRLAVDVTGKIDGSELEVTNNDTDVKLYNNIIGQVKEYSEKDLEVFEDYYTFDLEPMADGDDSIFGGMGVSVSKNEGTVEYHGFLSNGERFNGEATIRYVEVDDQKYLEFTVFTETKTTVENETIGTEHWFGYLTRISDKAIVDGKQIICIDCLETMPEPVSHPVLFMSNDDKCYMRSCGSAFYENKSLTAQLSTTVDNKYYLVVDPPPPDDEGGAVIAPRRLQLVEDEGEKCFRSTGDSLFGVALAYNVARQGQGTGDEVIVGEFSGTITLYSLEYEEKWRESSRAIEEGSAKKLTVGVHGILVAATQFCCSTEVHSVGLGYYKWDGVSYPVRIYWGRSVVEWDGSLNEEYVAPAAEALSPSQANGVAWPEGAEGAEDGQVVSGLADDGAEVEFNTAADILAVSDDGTVKIVPETDYLSLQPGNWTLCPVDLSGTNGEGEVMTLTVSDTIAMSLELKRGWNLIGIPETFDSDSLTWDSTPAFDALRNLPHSTLEVQAIVMTDALEPGKAYWVYAPEPQTFTLAGRNPESGESQPTVGGWWQKSEGGELEFCPTPEKHFGGWFWENGRFVYESASQNE